MSTICGILQHSLDLGIKRIAIKGLRDLGIEEFRD
jgi:hypothetical protein